MATWAFNNDNRFDLVAVPRPGVLAPDSRELILELETLGLAARERFCHAGSAAMMMGLVGESKGR